MTTLSWREVAAVAAHAGFKGHDLVLATAIVGPESGRVADVVQQGQPYSRTGWGLWQITPGNSVPSCGRDHALLVPRRNGCAAHHKYLWAGRSFSPWTTFNDQKYVPYLNHAIKAVGEIDHLTPAQILALIGDAGHGDGVSGVGGHVIIKLARHEIGDPYVYGAAGPHAFDCSGLIQYVLTHAGVPNVPRTTVTQWHWAKHVHHADLQAGDLIFSDWPGDTESPGHVAFYSGHGRLIEAPHTGADVQEIPFDHYYRSHVHGYGRSPGVAGWVHAHLPVTPGETRDAGDWSDMVLESAGSLRRSAMHFHSAAGVLDALTQRRHRWARKDRS